MDEKNIKDSGFRSTKKVTKANKNRKNMNERNNKKDNKGKSPIMIIVIILIILAIIVGAFFAISKLKDDKMGNSINGKTQKPKTERIIKTQKEINKREDDIKKAIRKGNTDYKYISVSSFLKHLEEMELYNPKKDEKKGNNIRIDGQNFFIEDYEVVDNKIQKKEDAPKIFLTDKVEYDSQGRMIVTAGKDGKVKFNPTETDKGRLVSVIDAKDYNLNDKLEVEYSEPVDKWEKGGSYIVKYKVENSRGKKAEREIPVYVK